MRSIYANTAKEYLHENRVKSVRYYSKRHALEFHCSGLITNHVIFARDVEDSTIATILHRCFPLELVVQFF